MEFSNIVLRVRVTADQGAIIHHDHGEILSLKPNIQFFVSRETLFSFVTCIKPCFHVQRVEPVTVSPEEHVQVFVSPSVSAAPAV